MDMKGKYLYQIWSYDIAVVVRTVFAEYLSWSGNCLPAMTVEWPLTKQYMYLAWCNTMLV